MNELLRSAALRPIRNLLRPLARRWSRPVPAQLPFGYVCYVDLRSAHGQGLLVTGDFDPELGRFIDSVLTPGGTFLDVGANLGYFSLRALSRVGARGVVHAFEMESSSLRCLNLTKRKGGLDNMLVHASAIGDREGTVGIMEADQVYQSWVNLGGEGVHMRPLDAWIHEFAGNDIQLIKIDVEGMEYRVLRGAQKILEQYRPMVVVEVIGENMSRFGDTPAELSEWMKGLGYRTTELQSTNDPTWILTPVERGGV